MEKQIKDLGCMNGWSARVWTLPDGSKRVEKEDTTPEEYKLCCRGNHYKHMEVVSLGRCWTQYTCPICGIRYNVDSSD